MEANPYQYKLTPGMAKEVNTPYLIITMRILRRLAEERGALSESEKAEIDNLEKKLTILMEGGFVGAPKRTTDF